MTTIAAAERAELKKQLRDLALDDKGVRLELKTIDRNERTALKTLRKAERESRSFLRQIEQRRKSLARDCNRDRKAAQGRRTKIAQRVAIVKGRLS